MSEDAEVASDVPTRDLFMSISSSPSLSLHFNLLYQFPRYTLTLLGVAVALSSSRLSNCLCFLSAFSVSTCRSDLCLSVLYLFAFLVFVFSVFLSSRYFVCLFSFFVSLCHHWPDSWFTLKITNYPTFCVSSLVGILWIFLAAVVVLSGSLSSLCIFFFAIRIVLALFG